MPTHLSLSELAHAYRQTSLSPREVTQAYLDKLEVGDVYRIVMAERAMQQAERAEQNFKQGRDISPLQGIPLALKDLFDSQGEVTAAGSKALLGQEPAGKDCPIVARLDKAGAVFLGKTTMTELAFSGIGMNPHFGTPASALDEARIPGGSSSGSGVAVAKGLACAALGSDTGGSVRIPAAFNGIVGLKTTDGVIPTKGVTPLSTTLDTIGPMTRNVEDAYLLWRVMAQLPATPFTPQEVTGLKLLVPTSIVQEGWDNEVAEHFRQACQTLEQQGLELREQEVPELHDIGRLYERYGNFARAESFALYEQLIADKGALMDERVAKRMLMGKDALAADYIRLHRARAHFQENFWERYHDIDAIIAPTVAILPPHLNTLEDDEAYFTANGLCLRNTSLFNFLGVPAISVPASPGQPIGIMIAARAHQEDLVLALAHSLEQAQKAST